MKVSGNMNENDSGIKSPIGPLPEFEFGIVKAFLNDKGGATTVTDLGGRLQQVSRQMRSRKAKAQRAKLKQTGKVEDAASLLGAILTQ